MSLKNPYTVPNNGMVSHKRFPKQARTQRELARIRKELGSKRNITTTVFKSEGKVYFGGVDLATGPDRTGVVKAADLLREAAKRNREAVRAGITITRLENGDPVHFDRDIPLPVGARHGL